jgi:hypothetical protein
MTRCIAHPQTCYPFGTLKTSQKYTNKVLNPQKFQELAHLAARHRHQCQGVATRDEGMQEQLTGACCKDGVHCSAVQAADRVGWIR